METDHVLELYRKLAPLYEEVYGVEQRRKYWMISSQVGEKVVDAGCGVGIAYEVLQSYVVCLDISIDMLAKARERASCRGDLVQADYWKPPFREGAFHSALFLSSADPKDFGALYERWRRVAARAYFEFRGSWLVLPT
ncbi:class I SAM-dependent methyltransferase [Pyrobaculum neutrophilum]|uniref:Methyltransferase type 11 n=1 Tax=Pyrobaculum neutrophilum (strain DSM 2338 / JCM 9278 / NBRC 100436 / V24Sta) TaxID=444157 RepID=B1Y9L6_PYRNV|nr:class I SAM-dependent methyltransferase [Pyrobaculum neutrophilum]ACB40445.1 Methyltransferase type 11 [Pyrobaculum neutrophilum V24Sta]